MLSSELHPWNWYVPQGAKSVIVGTFPPTENRWSFNFFYPNRHNHFWPILAHIAGRELQSFAGEEAVAERKSILQDLQVGVVDMGRAIYRKASCSSDENLHVIRYTDIFRMLDEYPSIRKLIFTSSTGNVNAVRWFKDYLTENGQFYPLPKGPRPLYRKLQLRGKLYQTVFLYSTSPRVGATISPEALTELYRAAIER
jgi:G:T/U-mismatch repair DNA glycosylase